MNTLMNAWTSYSEEVENPIAVVGHCRVVLFNTDFMQMGHKKFNQAQILFDVF